MANLKQVEEQVAQSEEGVPLEIEKPDQSFYLGPDGKPCTITVLGPESKRVLAAEKANRAKARSVALDDDDALEMEINRAAAAVVAWSGWTETRGDEEVPLPCTPEQVKTLLRIKHIRQQVVVGIARHGALFTRRST